jgi:hypothetical protein
VAIREALGEKTIETPDKTDDINNTVVPIVEEPVIPTSGFVTFSGTMGTYTAQPVILVGSTRYFLVGSAIDLIPYMGSTGATASGYLKDGVITLTKLTINGQLIWEQPVSINSITLTDNLPTEVQDQIN